MQYKLLVKKVSVSADKKTKQKDYMSSGKLPIIDQGKLLIGGYTDDISKQLPCNLPVIVFGDHTKNVKFISFPFGAGADGIKVLEPKRDMLAKYLYYGTLYLTFKIEDKGYARHYQHIEKQDLPVPPLPEQERIVARIEELFSELDKAVETLKKAKEQLAVYRQAVLKEAFDSINNFDKDSVQSICDNIVDCPHSTPKWTQKGKICLRTSNFKRGYLDLTEINYVSEETYNIRNARLIPQPGDVLYSREGAILGIACIIPENLCVCLGQRMMLLRPNTRVVNKFLMYYLNSPRVTAYVASITGGSASPHVNVGDIKNFKLPVPPISEQIKLIEKLESRLSVCDSVEKTIDTALQESEAMRQSILKKAFEGGL